MLLHHKPMLIGVQKGVKNETIAMLYSLKTVFLDFQNRKSTPFHRLSFLPQEFTKAIFLSFFRTKRWEFDYSWSSHLQGLPVRSSMECWTCMPRKSNAASSKRMRQLWLWRVWSCFLKNEMIVENNSPSRVDSWKHSWKIKLNQHDLPVFFHAKTLGLALENAWGFRL